MKIRVLKILACSLCLCAANKLAAQVTEMVLHSFAGGSGMFNVESYGSLVQGNDGNFYGTTTDEGTNNYGTVFRISPGGPYTNLYTFGLFSGDGTVPIGGLVQGSDGNFYGTTSSGGTNNEGTVFRISPGGSYTNLYSFGAYSGDGKSPLGTLVQGSDSNFYGTTEFGGTSNVGTVFRISTGGSETNLHSFGAYAGDANDPASGLVQGNDGNFYGTTLYGGGGTNGNGAVFRISPGGSYTNLHLFGSGDDGSLPYAGLARGSDGNLYGTTSLGGTNGVGMVFQISPSGSYANLYSFSGQGFVNNEGTLDGARPYGTLVEGSDANLYGTTMFGGTNIAGTVFRISPSGTYSSLYSFYPYSGGDGGNPCAGLVQGGDGNFYGITLYGGTNGVGAVFKLVVPLNPPANQISAIQIAGTNVMVTISSVAAEHYQLQFLDSLTSGGWSNVIGASATSPGGSLTVTNFGGFSLPQQFYRFFITP